MQDSVCVDNVIMTDVNYCFFLNDILKSECENIEFTHFKLFPGFELKFHVFSPLFEQIPGLEK